MTGDRTPGLRERLTDAHDDVDCPAWELATGLESILNAAEKRAEDAERELEQLREMYVSACTRARQRRRLGLVQGLQIELRAAVKARGEVEELLRELVDPTPCEPHPGNGFCQTHAARPPCPHGEAQRHLAAEQPEGTP